MPRPATPLSPDRSNRRESRDWPAWGIALSGWLLVVACAGRLLTPTESAPAGGTLAWALLSCLAWGLVALCRIRSGSPASRWLAIDGLMGLLCGAPLLSGLGLWWIGAPRGDLRAAISLGAEWIGLWATWSACRELQSVTRWMSRLNRLVACLVVALALLGVWQNQVGYRQARAEYRQLKADWTAARQEVAQTADPVARLRAREELRRLEVIFVDLGIPLDPSGQMLWESRLEHSQEPVGPFALANTFAGVLLTGLTAWLWPLARLVRPRKGPAETTHPIPRWTRWCVGLAVLPIAYCLLLTKCRSAWLAGLMMLPAGIWVARREWTLAEGDPPAGATSPGSLKGVVLVLAALMLLVTFAVLGGGLDRLVVLESLKSLRYRGEYWQGTWRMLTDRNQPLRWLTGVGPGQFRMNYLPHKLPESSEEIADPHNAVLDHWASGGLPGLVAVVGLWGWGLWRIGRRQSPPVVQVPGTIWPEASALGLTLAGLVVLTPDPQSQIQGVTIGLLTLLILPLGRQWLDANWTDSRASVLLLGLLLHLMFAGGIALPAITQLLLLAALPVSVGIGTGLARQIRPAAHPGPTASSVASPVERASASWEAPAETTAGGGRELVSLAQPVAAVVGMTFIVYVGLLPLLRRDLHLARGDVALERGQPPVAEREFRAAATADRWSVLPRERLALLAEQRWQGVPTATASDPTFVQAVQRRREVIELQPGLANSWRSLAELYQQAHARHPQDDRAREVAEQAVAAYREAARRHPTQSRIQAQLAEMLAASDDRSAAEEVARQALALDALNHRLGHVDKQLPADVLDRLKKLTAPPPAPE